MGDNGAGKSTLVKVIAGNFPPLRGRDLPRAARSMHFHKPVDARAKGIEVVYQDLALCNNLTAAANVFLGRETEAEHRARSGARLSRRCTRASASSSAS